MSETTPTRRKAKTPDKQLREAAADWAAALFSPVSDSRDRLFARLDRRLQRAAIRYADWKRRV